MSFPTFRTFHDVEGGPPPHEPLLQAYGGPLLVRRDSPVVFGNFVSTVDGVVAFGGAAGEGAGAVSINSGADRFLMALLRCAADVVLIGAGTLRDDLRHQWTPATVAPELAADLAAHRRRLTGATRPPTLTVVTASGSLPAGHPALTRPAADVVIVTTRTGQGRLPPLHDSVRVVALADRGPIEPEGLISALRTEIGARAILSEGGPHLFGQLLGANLVDELFLTLAPHLGGRSNRSPRPGMIEGTAFEPAATPQLGLRSLRQSGDHLFVRYAVRPMGS